MRQYRLLLICLLGAFIAASAAAQSYLYTPTEYVAPSLLASDGNLYGVDADGMFSFNLSSRAYSVVNSAISMTTLCSEFPDGALLALLNGTTSSPGITLEKITLKGAVSKLATLSYSDTICPVAASDGNYYGGSPAGGAYGHGYLFRMTPSGTVTVLYNFTGMADGEGPQSLVQGSDGNLYGIGGGGEMFRFTPTGGLTTYSSTQGLSGPLLEASDQNFYAVDGANIDRITPQGAVTTLPITVSEGNDQNSNGGLFPGGGGMFYLEENYTYPNFDAYPCPDSGGNWLYVFQLDPLTGATGGAFGIGSDEISSTGNDIYAIQEFLAGNGYFYGGFSDTNYIAEEEEGKCFGPTTTYAIYDAPAGTAAIQMTLGANRILPGSSTTLTWDINSAYSDTAQQCYGYGGLSGKVALSGSKTLTYSQPGTYNTAIICGGVQAAAVQVIAGDTQIDLSAQNNTVTEGQPVTLTAELFNTGNPAPTGKVEFLYQGQVLSTGTLNSQLEAGFTASTAGIPPGQYLLTAKYLGDTHYAAATSEEIGVNVLAPIATTTSLSTSTPSVYEGQSVVLSSTVTAASGGAPTGGVTFYAGATAVGGAGFTSDSGRTATATFSAATTGIAPGTYNVTAKYGGNGTESGSTSSPVTITVKPDGDSVALAASPNPVPSGQSFMLTATVTGSSGTPTGSVIFSAGSQELSSTSLNGGGVAVVTISSGTLAAGSYQVTAYYAGDSKNPAVTSPAIKLTVQ